MKSIAFTLTTFFFISLLGSNSFASINPKMSVSPENLIELKKNYIEDLKAFADSSEEAQQELAKYDNKDFAETILAGHRRNRRYYPPAYPVYPSYPVMPYIYTCFYRDYWGWVHNGTSPYMREADAIALYNCSMRSAVCVPAGCR